MKILLVCHYFPPEVGAPQRRLSELARFWSESGEEVSVLTGLPNHPTGIVPAQYKKFRMEESVDGYRVLRSWVYATPNERIARKTLGHLSFMITSLLANWRRVGSPDVVVVSSPTFFSIFSAWILARQKRARFVVEVRDLWPAIFVELGVITNRLIIGFLERLDLGAYRAADAVITVSEGFRSHIVDRGIPPSKVHTVRNGVDLSRFPNQDGNPSSARSLLGCKPEEVLVLYIGAHGISHSLHTVIQAADLLRNDSIHFALVGDGAQRNQLVGQAKNLGLDNVTMLSSRPADEIPALVAAADICLVPLRRVPLFRTFIPSKMFEYFAARRAVIGAVEGEAAEILHAAGAVVVNPEDPTALANAIRDLAADEPRRKELGNRARSYVESEFDRRALAGRYKEILAAIIQGG
jgi:glycosyltransferase involved in cell wall biosynthesis